MGLVLVNSQDAQLALFDLISRTQRQDYFSRDRPCIRVHNRVHIGSSIRGVEDVPRLMRCESGVINWILDEWHVMVHKEAIFHLYRHQHLLLLFLLLPRR